MRDLALWRIVTVVIHNEIAVRNDTGMMSVLECVLAHSGQWRHDLEDEACRAGSCCSPPFCNTYIDQHGSVADPAKRTHC